MADDPKAPAPPPAPSPAPQPTPDGSAAAPLAVTIVGAGGLPGGHVFPTPGIDETVPGGAYRIVGLDGSERFVDAEGNEVKKPRGT